jgi:hypothetical protein
MNSCVPNVFGSVTPPQLGLSVTVRVPDGPPLSLAHPQFPLRYRRGTYPCCQVGAPVIRSETVCSDKSAAPDAFPRSLS